MRVVVGVTAAILVISGCATEAGGSAADSPPSSSARPTPTTRVLGTAPTSPAAGEASADAPCGRGGTASDYTHVIWIWMENRSYSQVLGRNADAPRLASYGRKCAIATAFYALTHPSLPNYLAAVSGSTGGVHTDCSPAACPQSRATIFRQLSSRDRQWRTFAESMQSPCDRASYGKYAARHNPAVYFS